LRAQEPSSRVSVPWLCSCCLSTPTGVLAWGIWPQIRLLRKATQLDAANPTFLEDLAYLLRKQKGSPASSTPEGKSEGPQSEQRPAKQPEGPSRQPEGPSRQAAGKEKPQKPGRGGRVVPRRFFVPRGSLGAVKRSGSKALVQQWGSKAFVQRPGSKALMQRSGSKALVQ
jgi:hypothetical protein